MGLFDKKFCDICGEKIGLLGNRKLDDGNLCKNCAAKLSPFFSERRHSTVEQIREQLAYREANRDAVAAFHCTRTLGDRTKVYLDEDAGKFMVTSAGDLNKANPDVIDCSAVTGCRIDTEENKTELKHRDRDGKEISFNPPRYEISYDFYIEITVNHPYFDEIRFQLNDKEIDSKDMVGYENCKALGEEIKAALSGARESARQAAAPKAAVVCPRCGASTIPTADGRCEYCGGALGN